MMYGDDLFFDNAYFIIGTSYAGKSTMVKELAKKHNGIACEENYHDNYEGELDAEEFPCLCYTRDLVDWHDFIRRSPQEYKDWIDGVKKECEILELRMLPEICSRDRIVFVDTNICIETLKKIAPIEHTLVMLSDPQIPVHRFFDRPDPEKQFLYQLIMEEPDPEKAMENYRKGLELICSQDSYDELERSGFNVIYRDEERTIEQTVILAEKAFGLEKHILGIGARETEAFARIAAMEELFEKACSGNGTQEELAQLETYYTSTDWRLDYELDEAGLLPAYLKRGVLSEDGVYNLLESIHEYGKEK